MPRQNLNNSAQRKCLEVALASHQSLKDLCYGRSGDDVSLCFGRKNEGVVVLPVGAPTGPAVLGEGLEELLGKG